MGLNQGRGCCKCRNRDLEDEKLERLTLDFERTPLEPSIQTYSAMMAPFWGRSMYFLSCTSVLEMVGKAREQVQLTFAALETMVEFACEMCE
jgi:hypothetical protein